MRRAPHRAALAIPDAGHLRERTAVLDGAHQLPKRDVALAPDDDVHTQIGMRPLVGRERRIVAADDNPRAGFERPYERDGSPRGFALERHHREADDVGRQIGHQAHDRRSDGPLCEHEVGGRDPMMAIDVAGQ